MRPRDRAPPASVGATSSGRAGSGVPPQLTTSAAVTHSEAGCSAGCAGSVGIANTAALMRFAADRRRRPSRLSIVRAGDPPRRQRQLQRRAQRACARSAAGACAPVPAGICRPGHAHRLAGRRFGDVGVRPRRCRCRCSSRAGAGSRRRSAGRAAPRRASAARHTRASPANDDRRNPAHTAAR